MDDDQSTDPIAAALADDDQPQVVTPEPAETENQEASDAQADDDEVVETDGDGANTDDVETPPEGEQTNGDDEDLQTDPDPAEEARRRYQERQRAKAERDARISQASEEHLNDAEDEYDQRLRAMEVDQYKQKIEATENSLITEFERVKANPDLQIYNPDNKEMFDQRAYDKAIRDYNAGYVQYDQYGNMVGLKGSLFEHLTETAELLSGAVERGAVQQVRATRQMRSSADTKPAAQPKQTTKDPIMDVLSSDD